MLKEEEVVIAKKVAIKDSRGRNHDVVDLELEVAIFMEEEKKKEMSSAGLRGEELNYIRSVLIIT